MNRRIALVIVAIAACKSHEKQIAKFAAANPAPAPFDAPVFKLQFETAPTGKIAFATCDSIYATEVDVDRDSGEVRFKNFRPEGHTRNLCVKVLGYASGIGRDLDTHTYTFTILPKTGMDADSLSAQMRIEADALAEKLSKLERQVAKRGRSVGEKCPDLSGRVGFASTTWVKAIDGRGGDDDASWVWPGPFAWYVGKKDEHGERIVNPEAHDALTKTAAIPYVALIAPATIVLPTLLGKKFAPGKGDVEVFVGDIAAGTLLCRTHASFTSSERIEWRSSAASDARREANGDIGVQMNREAEQVLDESERNMRSDFELNAEHAIFDALKRAAPSLTTR